MGRFVALVSVVAIVVLGTLALFAQPVAVAQQATPAAEELMPAGTTFDPLGFVRGAAMPNPADLVAARSSLAPGAGFPLAASDPTGAFLVVEGGSLTVLVQNMDWSITRATTMRAMMATPEVDVDLSSVMEEVALGEEATLEAGDSAFIPGGVSGEVRNDGQERTDVLVFLVAPSEAMTNATPAP